MPLPAKVRGRENYYPSYFNIRIEVLQMQNESYIEWAEETANKCCSKYSVTEIISKLCKEIAKHGDVEKAKVIVANKVINGEL